MSAFDYLESLEALESLVDRYQFVVRRVDSNVFRLWSVELPNVFSHGTSLDEAYGKLREACRAVLIEMMKQQIPFPVPVRDRGTEAGPRDSQVNVRISKGEKAKLEALCKQFGFDGVSHLLREAAMGFANEKTGQPGSVPASEFCK